MHNVSYLKAYYELSLLDRLQQHCTPEGCVDHRADVGWPNGYYPQHTCHRRRRRFWCDARWKRALSVVEHLSVVSERWNILYRILETVKSRSIWRVKWGWVL